MRTRFVAGLSLLITVAVALTPAPTATAAGADPLAGRDWLWPVTVVHVVRPFVAPASPYAPGHRGLDLGDVERVRSPADGRVAFAGAVAGRPVVTIDHGDGLVTTFEPVTTELDVGAGVTRGDSVGDVALGGHVDAGALHFGVRWNGEYVNPLQLLGGVPRAILLPCC